MATEQEQKEALKTIETHMETVLSLTRECEKIADEVGIYFSFPKIAYGMGGDYYSKAFCIKEYDMTDPEIQYMMKKEKPDYDDFWGWRASSQSC